MKNTKEILKLSDKYIENRINLQTPIMEGRRVTAVIKDRYQTIVPVGSIIAITYHSPRENHGESQMKQKKASFAGMLDQQMQMLSVGKEENSTFQIYC